MGAAAVLLTVEQGAAEGSYSFVCPDCHGTVEKHADRKVVMLLLSAGVEVQEVGQLALHDERPGATATAVREPSRPSPSGSDAPPLTVDDLIDFHFKLRTDDWFRELIGADSLAYLELDRLVAATGASAASFCTACMSGEYPTQLPNGASDMEGAVAVGDPVRYVAPEMADSS